MNISEQKWAFVMVGLPARGKTFIARKVARYLSWSGHRARVFNVGAYRRERLGSQQRHSFFDPDNAEGSRARFEMAQVALSDMLTWLERDGDIALYDATNSTEERRAWVQKTCEAQGVGVVFVESICNDPQVIESNIRATKAHSPDYVGVASDEAVSDFQKRINHYANAYEEVHRGEGSYIKIIDVGQTVVAHQIEGYIPSRIVFFLLNCHLEPRSIWLTRHGESEFNVVGRIGGDPGLTSNGRYYAELLADFIRTRLEEPPIVWTSTLHRTVDTAEFLNAPFVPLRAIDEIDAGICDGMTYAEIAAKLPAEYAARRADKFRYRYPRGESYQDVIARLEPVIFELERERRPLLVIGHQAVLRALHAYLMDTPPEACPRISIPLHTVIELTPSAYGCDEQRVVLTQAADRSSFAP